jgi:hypothetical protein|nr:MAG TPA: hypothetical protein [Caudoviricetes sp.]
MGNYIDELASYLRINKIKQVEIADKLGISKAQVNSLLKGRDKFGERMAQRWEDELGINKVWLMLGEGEMLKIEKAMNSNILELKEYLFQKGLKQTEIAKKLDSTKQRVNNLLAGRAPFGFSEARKWEEAFNISALWLLTGEGEMLKDSKESDNASFVAPYLKDELIYLPLFSVSALASFADNLSQPSGILETYPVYVAKGESYTKERHIVIEAKGESMSPTIQNKAMILCEKVEPGQWDYIQNEKIIAIIYDNSFTIKRVLRNNLATANTITLSADNSKYGTLEVSRCDIKGIYRAIKKVSEYL